MKVKFIPIAIGMAAISVIGCNQSDNNSNEQAETDSQDSVIATYLAHLQPLNTNITKLNTTAEARFVLTRDSMLVTIDVRNAPPGIQHWQHFHGFTDNKAATCATEANDTNSDGIIDVVETEPVSGTTMVPFNDQAEEMNVGSDTYPKADADGSYQYKARISLEKLRASFKKSFGDSLLDLDRRVLYIHGVPENTNLAKSVASIGDIPAHVTLPIACGKIEKLQE
ncbi:MAG: hypothetical protein ABI325_09235 [Ginsengibacter sp.]